MLFSTHLIFTVLMGIFLLDYLLLSRFDFFLLLLGSLLPDLDSSKSMFGRKIWFLNFFLTHRGILHSLFFGIGMYTLFLILGYERIGLLLFLGFCSHIVLDVLTHGGIAPFYPFSFKVKGVIKTGSIGEYCLFFVFVLVLVIYLTPSL